MFRQFDELKIKLMRKRNTSAKRMKLLKKKAEILDMKNIINEIKKNLESLKNRADIMDERISDLEDRNIEMLQGEGGEN